MKCRSFVKFVPARMKGSGKPYQKAVKVFPRYFIKSGKFTPEPDMVECDGDVEVKIESDMEGECMCSSYSVLNINYKCNKCGNTFFEELPKNGEELSALVQSFFEELPEEERDKIIDFKVNEELEYRKRIDEELAKMKERTEKFLKDSKKKNSKK